MRKLLLAGVAATAFGVAAQASPVPFALTEITSLPNATGAMTVVFVFQDASDESTLSWSQNGDPKAVLIDNQNDPIGKTVAGFGGAGPVTFTLENITESTVFTIGTAVDDGNGNLFQHFQASTNFADFGVGALSAAAAAAVAAAGPGGIFIGIEDEIDGDYDFNDLIYYFQQVRIPGPAALGLFGIGLLGLAALRRRA